MPTGQNRTLLSTGMFRPTSMMKNEYGAIVRWKPSRLCGSRREPSSGGNGNRFRTHRPTFTRTRAASSMAIALTVAFPALAIVRTNTLRSPIETIASRRFESGPATATNRCPLRIEMRRVYRPGFVSTGLAHPMNGIPPARIAIVGIRNVPQRS